MSNVWNMSRFIVCVTINIPYITVRRSPSALFNQPQKFPLFL